MIEKIKMLFFKDNFIKNLPHFFMIFILFGMVYYQVMVSSYLRATSNELEYKTSLLKEQIYTIKNLEEQLIAVTINYNDQVKRYLDLAKKYNVKVQNVQPIYFTNREEVSNILNKTKKELYIEDDDNFTTIANDINRMWDDFESQGRNSKSVSSK